MDFNEKVKRNVANNFDQSIQVYQAFEAKHRFFSTYALKLAESIEIKHGSSVLDVGCGYGLSARVLNARYGCSVLGIDLSPEMIAAGLSLEKSEGHLQSGGECQHQHHGHPALHLNAKSQP